MSGGPGRPVDEAGAVRERYARRAAEAGLADRYHPLQPDVMRARHELEQVLRAALAHAGWHDVARRHVLEVGCGHGRQLQMLLQLGFAPEHLTGLDLLPERVAAARAQLPPAVALHAGDALQADVPDASQDLVWQSTVFSSLLDDAYQQRLADAMWRWVRPGGAVWWYDFTVDNPRNRDVRGVPAARVRALFPQGTIRAWRVTLAPPLARAVARWPQACQGPLHGALHAWPMLRTHLACWIAKPPGA